MKHNEEGEFQIAVNEIKNGPALVSIKCSPELADSVYNLICELLDRASEFQSTTIMNWGDRWNCTFKTTDPEKIDIIKRAIMHMHRKQMKLPEINYN